MEKNKAYTKHEWLEVGRMLFGCYLEDWRFKCPRCGNVARGQEFKDLGLDPNKMFCECIGRHTKDKGCDWAAYGLFDICTVHVDGHPVFEFAPLQQPGGQTQQAKEGKP